MNIKTFQKVMKPILKAHGFSYEKKAHNAEAGKWIIIVPNLSEGKQAKLKEIVKSVVTLLGDDFSINQHQEVRFDGTTVCNFWSEGNQYRFYNY